MNFDNYLAKEGHTWKDLVAFALDEHLILLLEDMVSLGELGPIEIEELYELEDYIKSRAESAMGISR